MSASEVVVLGAGGHAKVVVATCRAAGLTVTAVLDDARERWGRQLLGAPITGPIESDAVGSDRRAVIAIGGNGVRAELAARLDLEWATVVHPKAVLHDSVQLGEGTVVFAGAVVQPETRVGRHVIVNTGATIDHDCLLGDFSHVAPGSNLCGGVTVGEGALVGVGATVVPGVRIGPWAVVGAGAAVIGDVAESDRVGGVPAVPLAGGAA